ncbi:hypothetical protein MRB53_040374 [Persea americana]|nr:hypothetical protein MRB53_040374 [Persea americana]
MKEIRSYVMLNHLKQHPEKIKAERTSPPGRVNKISRIAKPRKKIGHDDRLPAINVQVSIHLSDRARDEQTSDKGSTAQAQDHRAPKSDRGRTPGHIVLVHIFHVILLVRRPPLAIKQLPNTFPSPAYRARAKRLTDARVKSSVTTSEAVDESTPEGSAQPEDVGVRNGLGLVKLEPMRTLGSSIDPFFTLPQLAGGKVRVENLAYLSRAFFPLPELDSAQAGLISTSPLVFFSSIADGACIQDALDRRSEDGIATVAIRQQIFKLISEELVTSRAQATDEMIMSIWNLLPFEALNGDFPSVITHLRGLEQMSNIFSEVITLSVFFEAQPHHRYLAYSNCSQISRWAPKNLSETYETPVHHPCDVHTITPSPRPPHADHKDPARHRGPHRTPPGAPV